MSVTQLQPIGHLLRDWRKRRHLSQLDLACEAEISVRHLSFLETGRSRPSREMLLHLAEELRIPLRERNSLLLAGGYAPVFQERSLADPAIEAARNAIDLVLKGHEPYPALAVDRHWNLIASNRSVSLMIAGAAGSLLKPPVNVLRLSLHPGGLAPRIANLAEWRWHLLTRLRRQIDVSADPVLEDLFSELSSYPILSDNKPDLQADYGVVAIPFQFIVEGSTLSFISTTTVFGTPVDITLSELALESFFPADPGTAAVLSRMASIRGA